MRFGYRIKYARKNKGYSIQGLADLCGVTERTQVKYEAGETYPKADYLMRLHDLGFDVMWLLTEERLYPELSYKEIEWLDFFNDASPELREAVLEILMIEQSGEPFKQRRNRISLLQKHLKEHDKLLLDKYNKAPDEIKNFVLTALCSDPEDLQDISLNTNKKSQSDEPKARAKKTVKQNVQGDGNITIGGNVKKK